jgi:hypothetical protein
MRCDPKSAGARRAHPAKAASKRRRFWKHRPETIGLRHPSIARKCIAPNKRQHELELDLKESPGGSAGRTAAMRSVFCSDCQGIAVQE